VDRRDIGSWLSTPGQAPEVLGRPQLFRGQHLNLPEAGSGSISPVSRRFVAIAIDWAASLLIASLVISSFGIEGDFGLITLTVFAVEATLFTWLTGSSFGQRLSGLVVATVSGKRLGFFAVLLRTLLICLVIPALVWDRDTRGLHDKATGTVCVRR
jgi:uncharacterized RDD family membrane protein YckC